MREEEVEVQTVDRVHLCRHTGRQRLIEVARVPRHESVQS